MKEGLKVNTSLLVSCVTITKSLVKHIDQALVIGKGFLSCLAEVGILEGFVDAAKIVFLCFVIVRVVHLSFPEQPMHEVMWFLFVHSGVVWISVQNNTFTLPKTGKVEIVFQIIAYFCIKPIRFYVGRILCHPNRPLVRKASVAHWGIVLVFRKNRKMTFSRQIKSVFWKIRWFWTEKWHKKADSFANRLR